LPGDELAGIVDRATPCYLHLTVMYQGKKHSLFSLLEEQLRIYNQLYHVDQQFSEVEKMAGMAA
jgi:hypothetical protein